MKREDPLLRRPTLPYFAILFSTTALIGLGLVMVLSSSSVKSFEQNGNTYSIFIKQLLFLAIAISSSFIALKLKPELWVVLSRVAIFVSAGFLVLPQIPGIGKNVNGNTNWIGFGPFTIQPSEFAKFGLILFCALQLRRYEERSQSDRPLNILALLLPAVLVILSLIMLGKDLGTALIVMGIAGAMLFVGGLPIRNFVTVISAGMLFAAAFVITQPNRLHRFTAVLHPFSAQNYKFAGWQTAHSVMGLASGGFFGVGLGASRQKWANLSEANTDFIFSVIGEEMGLLGTLVVLCLYAILIYGIFRVSVQTKDIFSRYATAGIACWLMLQVAVNLGSDIGLFPVIGVTLPFISYGGSSLIANCIGVAFVLNVARRESGVKDFLAHRKSNRGQVSGSAV
ncbi:MAG: putative lipid II flippase FtsW [Actinomycetes bacterium]